MKRHPVSELRRRFGPRVWWYSIGVLVLGLIYTVSSIALAFAFLVDGDEHQRILTVKRARRESISNEVSPLRGLDKEIGGTRDAISQFYVNRIPAGYSQIVSSLGEVAIQSGVSLSHVVYTQGAPGSDLSEVSMEVSVAGSYLQLVHFVNGIERNRSFFIIRALSFTGQQDADVTLHVRIATWLPSHPGSETLISSARATLSRGQRDAMPNGGK